MDVQDRENYLRLLGDDAQGEDWREAFDNTRKVLEDGEKVYEDICAVREEGMDILVCSAHLGDTVWVASLASEYLRQHDCDRVCYAVKESQNDIVRQFPDIDTTIILDNYEMSCLEYYIIVMKYYNHNHIVFTHMHSFFCYSYPMFLKLTYHPGVTGSQLDTDKIWLDLKGDVKPSRMRPLDDGNNEELKELFGKAVLLFPVSQTLHHFPMHLWKRLADEYHSRGYEVFSNYNGFDYELVVEDTKPLSTTIPELAVVAPYFAQVIGLRSGACDLMAETEANLSVVYDTICPDSGVRLKKEEINVCNIYDLVDRERLCCYQSLEGKDDEFVEAVVSQLNS